MFRSHVEKLSKKLVYHVHCWGYKAEVADDEVRGLASVRSFEVRTA